MIYNGQVDVIVTHPLFCSWMGDDHVNLAIIDHHLVVIVQQGSHLFGYRDGKVPKEVLIGRHAHVVVGQVTYVGSSPHLGLVQEVLVVVEVHWLDVIVEVKRVVQTSLLLEKGHHLVEKQSRFELIGHASFLQQFDRFCGHLVQLVLVAFVDESILVQEVPIEPLVDGIDQAVADGHASQWDLEVVFILVFSVDLVAQGRNVLACIGFAGNVELVLEEVREDDVELSESFIKVPGNVILISGITLVFVREAVSSSHRLIDVEHVELLSPGNVPLVKVGIFVNLEGPVLDEKPKEAGSTRAALKPQYHGSALSIILCRDVPEEDIRVVFLFDREETRVAGRNLVQSLVGHL